MTLNGSSNGGILVQNRAESWLILEIKEKQDMDPTLIELKKLVVDKQIKVRHKEEIEYFGKRVVV